MMMILKEKMKMVKVDLKKKEKRTLMIC